jgi:hypothetical protein
MQSQKQTPSSLSRRLAQWLRRLADWLAPVGETEADRLYPRALQLCREVEPATLSGSFKRVTVMKRLEAETGASRLEINTAIERAVRTIRHGD